MKTHPLSRRGIRVSHLGNEKFYIKRNKINKWQRGKRLRAKCVRWGHEPEQNWEQWRKTLTGTKFNHAGGSHQGAHVRVQTDTSWPKDSGREKHESPSLQWANSHRLQPPYRFKFVYRLPSRFKTKQMLLAVHRESPRSAHQEIAYEDGGKRLAKRIRNKNTEWLKSQIWITVQF